MGAFEILIILVVLTLIVGPRRLIGLGQSIGEALGRGARDFMTKIDGGGEKEVPDDEANKKQLPKDESDSGKEE